MTEAGHRRARKVWVVTTLASIAALILLRIYAPAVAPYFVGNTTPLLCLVGAGYHHGWLRGHRGDG